MKRLVILAPNWLGDAVMALPAIADVRRAAPDVTIAVAARASVAPLFALLPDVTEALVFGRDEGDALAQRMFDTAIVLPNSTRAALLVRRAAIPERWGYRTGWRGAFLTRAIPPARGLHQVEYYQRLVRALGFPNGPAEPTLEVPAVARDAGRQLLAASGWDGQAGLVAIAPGAAYGGAKRWPPQSFAELVRDLGADGVQCVMVGAAGDGATAREVTARSRTLAGRQILVDLVGRTDLATLAGVLANCRGLVTNDSGAMHLASAIGLDVTAMFGPTNDLATAPRAGRKHFGAAQPRVTVLTHPVWCRPCMLRECPLDHACMRGISVAAVREAARVAP